MLREVLTQSLVALSAIFVVVDPLAAVPFFLAMTSGQSPAERRETARRAALGAWLILTAFGLAGAVVFRLLGISIPAFMTRSFCSAFRQSKRMSGWRFPSPAWKTFGMRRSYFSPTSTTFLRTFGSCVRGTVPSQTR